jgi:hypothetical protein
MVLATTTTAGLHQCAAREIGLSIGKSLQRGARALFGLSKAHYSLTIGAKEHLVVLLEVVKKSKSNKGLKCIQASMPY